MIFSDLNTLFTCYIYYNLVFGVSSSYHMKNSDAILIMTVDKYIKTHVLKE